MDVGSTTVKAVVIDAATDQILWSDYQRHDTKQPEKVLEFLQALRDGNRRLRCRRVPHVRHGLRRQRPRPNSWAASSCRKSTRSRSRSRSSTPSAERHRAWRPGRQDHHLQDRPGNRPQEEDAVDERQVRRRHRRGHRQDQRQAPHPGRTALRDGLQGHQASPRRRQVRRVRRDRYQRSAKDGRAARRTDGLAVRSHRHAEPLRC